MESSNGWAWLIGGASLGAFLYYVGKAAQERSAAVEAARSRAAAMRAAKVPASHAVNGAMHDFLRELDVEDPANTYTPESLARLEANARRYVATPGAPDRRRVATFVRIVSGVRAGLVPAVSKLPN
ncbi:MAG: hypothetical protein JO019_04410 [Candidatus Kaiserbacteria bacterium]|nr:hypothetical protein [Candidatus Kaiserbacteria bacterium]